MTSTFVAASSPNVRVSYSRLYQLPERDQFETNPTLDDEAQPIGWDRRYGMLFFSERALLYGPYSVATAEEKFILSQFPNFMRDRGKKCLYRIFEAYTAIKLGRSGLRARPRDPATDRVYYFPSHYPSCIALSVLHYDGDSCRTCAALIYKFRTPEVAALAFKMLTDTNSVPRGRRTSLSPATFPVAQFLTKSSPTRAPSRRNGSTRRVQEREVKIAAPRCSVRQSRSRQIDIQSSPHWGASYIDFEGSKRKLESPEKIFRGRSHHRSKSRSKGQKGLVHLQHQNCCCCNHQCIHCGGVKNCHSAAKGLKGNIPKIEDGSLLIINGKKYPLSLLHELVDQFDETAPAFRLSESKSTTSSDSSSSNNINGVGVDNDSADSGSGSGEPVVELVFDKLKNTSKLNGTEMTFCNRVSSRNGMRGDGGTPVTVIRLSRQGHSDSEQEDGINGCGYLASPTKVLGDGTTVYNLYGRQRSEDRTIKQFNNPTFTADETPDETPDENM
ncbi:unnamed protein product [Hydatigera taeniaeformis]|uniref:SET domain-containing protein n=1 Tax=Hydatigena taeniaeformis TaxID=6205 RepID=A0A0R3X2G1_HYDTA|nr:unnamed protein product [Hydatigera taeniaeformis]